jgi:hypothetical protein
MKNNLLALLLLIINSSFLLAQYNYEPSPSDLHGLPNPEAPPQIKDFQPMIGICDCTSSKINKDGNWADPIKMTWEFKYIMNGMAVQDQTLKEDGGHTGNIRQFNADSSLWYVHYYSSANQPSVLKTWQGGKKQDKIILYSNQKSPNGMDGKYRITFKNISDNGFSWIGEWVSLDESIVFPTWKIECNKRK